MEITSCDSNKSNSDSPQLDGFLVPSTRKHCLIIQPQNDPGQNVCYILLRVQSIFINRFMVFFTDEHVTSFITMDDHKFRVSNNGNARRNTIS